ncbi:LuxR C-terminal-related transcriptional regulator [Cohnella fermenti]|uniref:HTH luxR-type domain-containing protein n=1 Tax=Cohnella fermenti TaxID=2565925 RepID=A0A4S4BG21_9BACL|nr:LuxR C-terminal-related transcriptional regulator [Cohnella fermenti]THF73219.1 hypothetical protein E6C55_30190 [Cohnella fermenti]
MRDDEQDPIDSLVVMPILTTKIHIPRETTETVQRSRLIDRLNQGLRNNVTVVCAPAGFGKSTLLEHWARQAAIRPAWFSIDRGDNDLKRFWHYVIASIDLLHPGFRERTDAVLKLVQPAQYELALTMLLNELHSLDKPVALILDDFHTLTDDNLIASVAYFIEYMPESVHLTIVSREELPFPTARLQSRQLMSRLDTPDLRFTLGEGRQFYRTCMALALPEEEEEEWLERTEGWITAMKLAALSLRVEDNPSMLLRKFTGASLLIEQYLMEEVFDRQSEPIQQLLMDCSILKRMNASLCRALTGFDDCQEMLEQLERAQLFMVSLDDRRGWYRFHHLFAEFLYNRLLRTNPDRIPYLLEAAGRSCEADGYLEEALEYYLTGKLYERSVGLLEETTAKMLLRMNTDWLCTQLALIPEPILLQYPFLYFSYIHLLLLGEEQAAKADRLLSYAEKHYEGTARGWTEESKNDFWASYYFNKMLHAALVLGDQNQVIHYMNLSKQYRPKGPRLVFARQSRLAGKPSISKEHPGKMIVKEFLVSFLNQMIETFDEAGLAGSSLVCLAEGYYEFNELDEAEKNVRRAIRSTDLSNPMLLELVLPSRLLLSRIQQARGLYDEAKELLRSARHELIDLGLATTLIYCDAERAWLALREGDSSSVEAWMRMYRLTENDPVAASRLVEYQYLVRFLIYQERYEPARELANRLAAAAEAADRWYIRVEVGVMQTVLLHLTGRTDEALIRLKQHLHATEAQGFVRAYVDAGETMAELLAKLIEAWPRMQEGATPSLNYARRILAAFGRNRTNGGESADVPLLLTRKEIEILRLIAQRLTNKEIAARLQIGYGTVRSHINHIYSKLEVRTRPEAIQKGESLGL